MRPHSKARFALVVSAGLHLAFSTGCAAADSEAPSYNPETDYADLPGAGAVWRLARGTDIGPDDTDLTIEVMRVDCAGGVTGEVLGPVVEYKETQIVITQRVESLPPGGYTCPSNDLVPAEIELTEKIGDRELVDGECLYGDGSDTIFCETPVRWNVETGAPEDFW